MSPKTPKCKQSSVSLHHSLRGGLIGGFFAPPITAVTHTLVRACPLLLLARARDSAFWRAPLRRLSSHARALSSLVCRHDDAMWELLGQKVTFLTTTYVRYCLYEAGASTLKLLART